MKSEFRKFAVVVATLSLAPVLSWAAGQVCGANIAAEAPDARYTASGETVTDTYTGLMWKKCSEGLAGAACAEGTAKDVDWAGALALAATANSQASQGYSDWRLPNRNELATLVEHKCENPAINATVFPGTPSQTYWTSSPDMRHASMAWQVDFNVGDVSFITKSSLRRVRLVRGR